MSTELPLATDNTLSGIWKSEYVFHNSIRNTDATSTHYVRLHPQADELVAESLPGVNDSYVIARLRIDDNIATGTWQEVTSPSGDYKGTIYYGALQLNINPERTQMTGQWVGFDRKMQVKNGPWTFTYLGEDESVIEKDKQRNA